MNPRPALIPALFPTLLLGSLLACGGGSSNSSPGPQPGPAIASRLTYTDPTTGTYQLKQNPALSTPTHLVLELWGPAGTTGSGVSVAFTLGGSAGAWRNVLPGDAANTFVANGTAFDLGTGTPILKATVNGATLVAAVAEKGLAAPKALNKALLQVAVDLQPGIPQGTVSTLTPSATRCLLLLPTGERSPILITASNLTAQ